MNVNIKPHLIISHLLPGCFFLLLGLLAYNQWNFASIKGSLRDIQPTELIGLGIVFLIAAFLAGEIFDSARDGAIEGLFKRVLPKKVRWDYFYDEQDPEKLQRFEEYYFTWYIFNMNSAISLIAGGIVTKFYMTCKDLTWWIIGIWLLSIVLLIVDAITLRNEMARHSNKITP